MDNKKEKLKDYLNKHILITDGAFGTYYVSLYDTQELPEKANLLNSERVMNIHSQYVNAGAKLIRTNTFACNTIIMEDNIDNVCKCISAACEIARRASDGATYIAGDIGPVPYDNMSMKEQVSQEYITICDTFIKNDVDAIVFETFSELDDILPAIEYIKSNSDIFVLVQFSVNQFGYSNAGLSVRRLFEEADNNDKIDGYGLNCGVGPGHMNQLIEQSTRSTQKYISSLPNAGYPQNISNRMIFASDNIEYFASKMKDIADNGISILGGCCGTTPDYIQKIHEFIDVNLPVRYLENKCDKSFTGEVTDNSFYKNIDRKLIAVELAPPIDSDDHKLMEAAHILEKSNVDVITFPDSPSGRTRADSILMAEKVSRETGIKVMPHICCRDKNAIAIRSQLLGSHINGINNFLVITGDPIPQMVRQSVKAVFNFDSVGMMNIISDMNCDQFISSPIVFGGAINQNRRNFELEIERVKKKMCTGASFFLTQPVFTQVGADRLKRIKDETGARILCGIMPFVSLRNAIFMKNEMTGIEVSDDIIEKYKKAKTKDEGEAVGVDIARNVISMTKEFVDGYYFSFPFNRVYLLEKILD